jgi:hypothetical protein
MLCRVTMDLMEEAVIRTAEDLVAATGDGRIRRILVHGEIGVQASLTLAPGQRLIGGEDGAALVFAPGADGIGLTRDNEVSGLRVEGDPAARAVFVDSDSGVEDLGRLRLSGLTVVGQVQLVADGRVRAGHVEVDGLDIVAADTRDRAERPALLGVGVLQGAFTLWNRNSDAAAVLTADLRDVGAGRDGAPVRGSGVFVAGAGPDGGKIEVNRLDTGPVFTDGGIPEGTSDTITGGVFVVYGAHVREVQNRGPVTTYGVNDMVLDNWGVVDGWTAHAPLTSRGRNGVGMVNFGSIGSLRILAPIETYGVGARGFNVYRLDGYAGPTVDEAVFDRITTHGDAAIGIQIGQPIGRLRVNGGIVTSGGAGDTLVRGAITRLSAHALSILPGGHVDSIEVGGDLTSAGADVAAVDVRGEVATISVVGGIRATGGGADALRVDGGRVSLHGTEVHARDGAAVRVLGAGRIELHGVEAHGSHGDVMVQP